MRLIPAIARPHMHLSTRESILDNLSRQSQSVLALCLFYVSNVQTVAYKISLNAKNMFVESKQKRTR